MEHQLGKKARTKRTNAIHGAWEGGLPVSQLVTNPNHASSMPYIMLNYNVRGGLGRKGGIEAHELRLEALIEECHAGEVVVAVFFQKSLP